MPGKIIQLQKDNTYYHLHVARIPFNTVTASLQIP